MISLFENGGFVVDGKIVPDYCGIPAEEAKKNTIAHGILAAHNTGENPGELKLKFDALVSHDITYVGVIQTARASGMTKFPVPYILTNCHNSLCAVGGTINEDDHAFGYSAAVKYGGVYVPPHLAVIHTYMREMYAGCGKMILGTDSHTRYGALGTMAIGEGGGEIAKQLLNSRYEAASPEIIGVRLNGSLRPGTGPHDVSLALIKAVFASGFAKNCVLEFFGGGIKTLSMDTRNGIDVMTTETACLSSIWETDEKTREFLAAHGREGDYAPLKAAGPAYYDKLISIDLSEIEPMIALPYHPSNAYTIRELNADLNDILRSTDENAAREGAPLSLASKARDGALWADQGSIVGCAGGTFENICAAADILEASGAGGDGQFALSVYPGSQPVNIALASRGAVMKLMKRGAIIRTAFCGPCFGAGDVPKNGGLSVRHATRNFQSREGSKPGEGQRASVALMDARSIAATAANGGKITAAGESYGGKVFSGYRFSKEPYERRVYNGWAIGAQQGYELEFGPNIADWPPMKPLAENVLLYVAAFITDAVTTTDELIPSGETSSYRSNPVKLAEFTLSRKRPEYAAKAKEVKRWEELREQGAEASEVSAVFGELEIDPAVTAIGSVICAHKPGDGSAREQAASCQRVLGGLANIAAEYATKRYLSNLINWGILPFTLNSEPKFREGDFIYIRGVKKAVDEGARAVGGVVYRPAEGRVCGLTLGLPETTPSQRRILLAGSVINENKKRLEGYYEEDM